jgi:hypothetical protein
MGKEALACDIRKHEQLVEAQNSCGRLGPQASPILACMGKAALACGFCLVFGFWASQITNY